MKTHRATLIAGLVTLAAAGPLYLTLRALEPMLEGFVFLAEGGVGSAPRVVSSPRASEPQPASAPESPPELAEVRGLLLTLDGTPVPDETVELSSASLEASYSSTSDAHGRFAIPGVAPARDYEVRVASEGRYRDYTELGLAVDTPAVQLELVLEPLARARLAGRMIDSDGAPIPGRTLLLQASHTGAQLLVTGDESGHFRVEDAPTGRLTFTTTTVPRLKVRGPLLKPAAEAEVSLVLDEGRHELSGRVVGDHDAPVSGAQLKLSWSYREGGALSSSARTTVTDADGGFRFTDLGPGPHQLAVRARGYEEARETFRVSWNSEDVELRLRPDYR